jgi:antitoxin component HigA of HigAB toxin-antitoxin module
VAVTLVGNEATMARSDQRPASHPRRALAVLRHGDQAPIGARLLETSRAALGVTNTELAARLGVSDALTSRIRHGDRALTAPMLAKLGKLLSEAGGGKQ